MSTIYSGNPSNVTTPLVRNVAGTASAAGLIRIQTTAAHLFSTYNTVELANVGGTTEANGTWVITVIDSTHFDLAGSTWANAWTSGGTATDFSLTPAATLPSDGEPATAASILASVQLLLDRTQYLQLKHSPPVVRAPLEALQVPLTVWGVDLNGGVGLNNTVGFYSMGVSGIIGAFKLPNLRHGATLLEVDVLFAVAQAHSFVPGAGAGLPTMGVYRSKLSVGDVPAPAAEPLSSHGQWIFPAGAGGIIGTGAAWYALGHVQPFQYPCNQHNVIDTENYAYFILIGDESGSNSLNGNTWYDVIQTYAPGGQF
jgi:hypothetical protein